MPKCNELLRTRRNPTSTEPVLFSHISGQEMFLFCQDFAVVTAIKTKEPTMSENSNNRTYRILLAEDDEVNQDIVRAFLADTHDLELTVASDGRLALEEALVNKYDLLIFDQQMPHITGDRVLLHLRAGRSLNAATPVIRFTAAADARPAEIRRLGGVAEVTLPKPLRRETFVSTVKAMLGLA